MSFPPNWLTERNIFEEYVKYNTPLEHFGLFGRLFGYATTDTHVEKIIGWINRFYNSANYRVQFDATQDASDKSLVTVSIKFFEGEATDSFKTVSFKIKNFANESDKTAFATFATEFNKKSFALSDQVDGFRTSTQRRVSIVNSRILSTLSTVLNGSAEQYPDKDKTYKTLLGLILGDEFSLAVEGYEIVGFYRLEKQADGVSSILPVVLKHKNLELTETIEVKITGLTADVNFDADYLAQVKTMMEKTSLPVYSQYVNGGNQLVQYLNGQSQTLKSLVDLTSLNNQEFINLVYPLAVQDDVNLIDVTATFADKTVTVKFKIQNKDKTVTSEEITFKITGFN